MQMFRNKRRPADIRKCAVIAALIAAISVVALETAGSALRGSYAGLDGRLSPANTVGSPATIPTTSSPR